MKNRKIEVLWLFQKAKTDAPIKIRIGVVHKHFPTSPKFWKGALMLLLGSAIPFSVISLFEYVFS